MFGDMGRKPLPPRVLGPYERNDGRWAIEIRLGPRSIAGARETVSFGSEAEAAAYKATIEQGLPRLARARTFKDAIEAYQVYLTEKGNKEKSWKETIRRLGVLFGPVLHREFGSLKEHEARALYQPLVDRLAPTSQLNYLAEAKSFTAWCVRSKFTTSNPVSKVEPKGTRDQGKEQLRTTEARALYDICLWKAARGDEGAVATLMLLLVGLRASEITLRVVRDVDDEGRLLHVPHGKTKAAKRVLDIPPRLAGLLHVLAKDRSPTEPLFRADSETGHHTKDWPREQARRLCRAAGVPEVTAHGLRGTQASLARETGAAALLVAQTLGHEDVRMQDQAYVNEGARERGRMRRAMRVLEGGKR